MHGIWSETSVLTISLFTSGCWTPNQNLACPKSNLGSATVQFSYSIEKVKPQTSMRNFLTIQMCTHRCNSTYIE